MSQLFTISKALFCVAIAAHVPRFHAVVVTSLVNRVSQTSHSAVAESSAALGAPRHGRDAAFPRNLSASPAELYAVNEASTEGVKNPELLAATAVAVAAAAGHRAIGVGHQLYEDVNSMYGMEKLLRPPHTVQFTAGDPAFEASQAAAEVAASLAVTPNATLTAVPPILETIHDPLNASLPLSSFVGNSAQQVNKSGPESDVESPTNPDNSSHRKAHHPRPLEGFPQDSNTGRGRVSENRTGSQQDSNLWPATDLPPMQSTNQVNGTAYPPAVEPWQARQDPPRYVLMIPLIIFLLGSVCIFILWVGHGHPFRNELSIATESSATGMYGRESLRSKTDEIFQHIDQDRDGFVSLPELRRLAQLTNPNSTRRLTMDWFQDLCRPLGADPRRGLDRREFCQTYVLLDNDVDKDYAAVRGGSAQCDTATNTCDDSVGAVDVLSSRGNDQTATERRS